MEQKKAMASDTTNALKANRLAITAAPEPGRSSATTPPGTVKAAANATVAIRTDPIVPVLEKSSSSLSEDACSLVGFLSASRGWTDLELSVFSCADRSLIRSARYGLTSTPQYLRQIDTMVFGLLLPSLPLRPAWAARSAGRLVVSRARPAKPPSLPSALSLPCCPESFFQSK